MDFFDAKFVKEPSRKDSVFGLVDDGEQARSTTDGNLKWIAVVNNQQCKEVQFVPVDHKKHRFAYAANRRHPHFQFSQKQVMQQFYNQYKFRLLFQNKIDVK